MQSTICCFVSVQTLVCLLYPTRTNTRKSTNKTCVFTSDTRCTCSYQRSFFQDVIANSQHACIFRALSPAHLAISDRPVPPHHATHITTGRGRKSALAEQMTGCFCHWVITKYNQKTCVPARFIVGCLFPHNALCSLVGTGWRFGDQIGVSIMPATCPIDFGKLRQCLLILCVKQTRLAYEGFSVSIR